MARTRGGAGDGGAPERKPAGEVSPWEWVAAAIGTLLVLATIAFLAHAAFLAPDGPPHIVVRVDSIVPLDRGYLVRVTAANEGGETVAGLQIGGELGPDSALERSEAVIDYVPAGGVRRAGLFFSRDPREAPLRVRPVGFDEP